MTQTHDVAFMPATVLREQFVARELSPVEVTRSILDRIATLNPVLTAFITVTPELALEQAAAAERAYADGSAGPLAGIPISIKDLTAVKGVRMTRGSLVDPDFVPDFNAPFVERVIAAGGVILGKTNTPELGWKGDSTNRIVGSTQNPWELGKTAGGSSGGAAAAVAAGLGPLAQGSDGAGSIRIPAAFCGIYGFKPSFGLVPQFPASAVGDVSHLGPMTRTVRDAALLLDVVAGADSRDRLSWSSGEWYLAACEGELNGLRVAWAPLFGNDWVRPDILERTTEAAHRFEDLGCIVEEVQPDLPPAGPISSGLWASAMAGYFLGRFDEVKDLLDPDLVQLMDARGQISGAEVASLLQQRNAYYEAVRRFMEPYDLLLTPQLPITAFAAGLSWPPSPDDDAGKFIDWSPYTYPFNLTGQPAASVPHGFGDDGLPVGLQIVGGWRNDALVLRASAAYEADSPWAHLIPSVANID